MVVYWDVEDAGAEVLLYYEWGYYGAGLAVDALFDRAHGVRYQNRWRSKEFAGESEILPASGSVCAF